MDVREAIRRRRSIKPEKMKPDPVPRSMIEALLEAANWAPSHGLTEPWRFIVFTGDERKELGEAILTSMADGRKMSEDDPRRAKVMNKVLTAPAAIVIVCEPSDKPNIEEHEEIASTAMAVQNMHLLARSMGLAGFWSSGKKAFHREMAKFLGLESPARCLGFFYVGWPAVPWPEGERRPVEDKVKWMSGASE